MQWATITGSSNGIGAALAEIFAKNGYSIILHGRDESDLSEMYKKIISYGVEASIVRGEISAKETLEDLTGHSIEKDIEVLINNVGYRCPGVPFEDMSSSQIEEMLNVNCKIVTKLTKEIYKNFQRKRGGCIINMNSIRGLEPKKNRTLYTATRFYLRGLSEALRLEGRNHNIRILSIYPARVKTKPEFEYGWPVDEAAKKMYRLFAEGKNDDLILDCDEIPMHGQKTYPIKAEIYYLAG